MSHYQDQRESDYDVWKKAVELVEETNKLEEGTKFDSDKASRPELIAPEIIDALGVVLAFGAKKYTIKYETEWDKLLDAPGVESIQINIAKECVVSVTKKTSDELTMSTQRDRDVIVGIGRNSIQTELRKTPNVGKMIQSFVREMQEQNSWDDSKSLISQRKNISNSVEKVAKSVDQRGICTLIIATTQGNLEVSFVQNVIMDSGFWETIWRDLREQLNIYKPSQTTGDRNWEKGMDWGRAYGALQRHLNTWWSGDDLDDETNFSHLHHAACCLMFLIAWESRGIGTDSRNKL